jgi:hypothetical protein
MACLQMDHAAGVLADLVHSRMDGEARGIDGIRGVSQSVAVGIDLDEARSGDLLKHHDCSACDTVRLFRVNDGYPIIAKLAKVDEETREEERERKLADERTDWLQAYQNAVRPWRDPEMA